MFRLDKEIQMERIRHIASVLPLAFFAASCSEQASPPGLGSADAAPSSKLCSLFTVTEIEELLGARVAAGNVAGPAGTACQWSASGDADDGYAQIQVIEGSEYWSKPELADGYEAVSGIGQEAFAAPERSGWTAGALRDEHVAIVALNGGAADRDDAVRLLRSLVERL